jgi:hypothetical protein
MQGSHGTAVAAKACEQRTVNAPASRAAEPIYAKGVNATKRCKWVVRPVSLG